MQRLFSKVGCRFSALAFLGALVVSFQSDAMAAAQGGGSSMIFELQKIEGETPDTILARGGRFVSSTTANARLKDVWHDAPEGGGINSFKELWYDYNGQTVICILSYTDNTAGCYEFVFKPR